MKRTSRRLFFHAMVDFPIGKRYFGGRVRKERSGRPRREKKDTKYSYDKYGLLHRSRLNVFADVDNIFDKLLIKLYQFFVNVDNFQIQILVSRLGSAENETCQNVGQNVSTFSEIVDKF